MIDVCVSEATSERDMSFNAKKSAVIGVGNLADDVKMSVKQ